ncbi:tetratricopeptide repeat protein [Amycolatopsis sp. NPDC021455]|uniref:tetratricopeptide repeat protein n=1 Tax=Amycolatopsis sp. NPDC021455 TaxID=3154901 RepID=UPI00340C44E1
MLANDDRPGTVIVSAIDGAAGIGKTTLALTWAHRAAERFPDGQLYVNLRGFEPAGAPMPPEEALRGFLAAFRIPADSMPAEPQALSALYRSLVAGRRLLVVLDNARDSEQVRPLLPGSPACAVVITSRNRLTELVVRDSARLVTLDMLSPGDARELLARQLGDERMTAEPEAVSSLVRSCAGLPLALTIAAARGAADPQFPLTAFADELQDERSRLAGLEAGDPRTDLESVFSWSYRALSPPAAGLFRCLGAQPGADAGLEAISALAGGSVREGRALVAELVRANLADQYLPGRYRMHDLLRLYARHLTSSQDDDALNRMCLWYRDRAAAAVSWLDPRLAVDRHFRTYGEAISWLETERGNLVAIVLDEGNPRLSAELACLLSPFFHERRNFDDWHRTLTAAFRPADGDGKIMVGSHLRLMNAVAHTHVDLGDERPDDANALVYLAKAQLVSGRSRQAHDTATTALARLRTAGDRRAEGWALLVLADVCTYELLFDEATDALKQAAEIWRELGDRWFEAETLMRRAWADRYRTQVSDAVEWLDRAYAIYDSFGDSTGKAKAVSLRGSIVGQYGDAKQAYEAQLLAHRFAIDAADLRLEADVLDELCQAARQVGKIPVCRDHHDRWTAVAEALGDPDGITTASTARGTTYSLLGDHTRAISILREQREQARGLRLETEGWTIGALGEACFRQGRVTEALRCYAEYENLVQEHSELLERALHALFNLYFDAGRLAEGIACAVRRIEILGTRGDPGQECFAWDNLGYAFSDSGRYREAIAAHTRALEIRSTMGIDSYRHGWGLVDSAYAYFNAGRFDEGLGKLHEACSVRERAGNSFGTHQVVSMIACVHITRREFDSAHPFVERVLQLPSTVDEPAVESLSGIFRSYSGQYRFDDAEVCYRRVLPIARLLGDRKAETDLRRAAAQMRLKAGRSAEALELLRHDLEVAEASTDFATAAQLRTEIVTALTDLRHLGEAEHEVRQGIQAALETESFGDHVRFLNLRGRILRKQGRFEKARRVLATGIALADRHGDLEAKAELLAGLATTCLEAGDPRAAAEAQRTRLELDRAAGDDRKVAVTLAELSRACGAAADRSSAARFLDAAVTSARQLEDPRATATALGKCARAAQTLELFADAEQYLVEQGDLSRKMSDLGAHAKSLSDLAELHRRTGRLAEARRLHQRSLDVRRELGDPPGIAGQLRRLGVVVAELDRFDEAVELLNASCAMAGDLGEHARLADACQALAAVYERRGDTRRAGEQLARSRSLYQRLDGESQND